MGFFQAGLSKVRVRVQRPCDLGYKSWSQILESWATRRVVGENHIINTINSFDALPACDGRTDRQTDTPRVAKWRCRIAERDKTRTHC